MKIAIPAAVGQRVFQQGQQGFGIQLAQEQIAHVTQESTRRRQMQRQARAVVGQDVPPVQRRGHLTRQHPVRGDQRGGFAILDCLAQAQRNRKRFGTRGGGLYQG